MAITASPLSRVENAGITGFAVAAGAAILLAGLMPHTERALLSTDGPSLQPKAFAAVVAPLDPKQSQAERGLLNGLAATNPRGNGRPTGTSARSIDPGFVAPPRVALADTTPGSFPNPGPETQAFAAPQATTPSGGTNPFPGNPVLTNNTPTLASNTPNPVTPVGAAPTVLNNSASTSGGTTSGGSTSGGTGAGSTTSGGTTATGTPTQTSAVPEPGTWITMIFGFAIMGLSLRRRQAGRVKVTRSNNLTA